MSEFLHTFKLALTPLSPIHIGCGEDFEPTNYVIDDGVLFGFDPSRAALNDLQKSKLADAANRASLLAIQRFFKDNAKDFMAQADVLIPVSSGIAKKYDSDIGRAVNTEANGNQVFNKFVIERHSYTGAQRLPYIPGSSFKGAMRTAWLDHLNGGLRPQENCGTSTTQLEQRLFKGDFATSPLRLLKVADLMPDPQQEPQRHVLFAVNRKKRQVIKDGQELQPKGIAARKECIMHGQFRAFVAEATLPSLDPHSDGKLTPSAGLRLKDFKSLAKHSNSYSLDRFHAEMAVMDSRGFVNPDWKKAVEALLSGRLKSKLAAGEAFLIRLGRYGGAASKTLSGNGVANIKIMGGRGQAPTFESTTKTLWLAAENENEQKHLLPFGWAVVEIDPRDDMDELKAWCAAQSKGRRDLAALRRKLEAEKLAAAQQKLALREQAQAREAAKQAELAAAAQRELALASMSQQAQEIEKLRQKCEELDARISGGNFKKHTYSAGNPGLIYLEAMKLVNAAMAAPEWSALDKQALADMLEHWLPKVIAPWEAKEQRKKLKFSMLRGQNP